MKVEIMNISLRKSLFGISSQLGEGVSTQQVVPRQFLQRHQQNYRVVDRRRITAPHGLGQMMAEEKPAQRVARILTAFDPISLSDMDGVALLNRVDTKFLFGIDDFYALLPRLAANYRVLEIKQRRLAPYRNLYFDTADLALYQQHHNGGLNRHKVRSREYVDSNLSFLEVKFKTNKKRTIKNRMRIEDEVTQFAGETEDFMQSFYPDSAETLIPTLWNNFTRITLVSKHAKERLTFDINLSYRRGNTQTNLDGIVIAEVKQERFLVSSDFIQEMRLRGIRKSKFSKYCIGVTMLFDDVKTNNFKSTLLFAKKIAQRSLS